VEVVSERTDSKLVGFGVLSCWLQVSCKCARLQCVRIPFVKGKQWYRIRREGYDTSQLDYGEVQSQQAHRVIVAAPVRFGTLFLASFRFCVHYCMDRDTVQKKKNRALRGFFVGLSTTNLKII